MSRIPSTAITAGLIGSGVLAWALAGRPLVNNPELKAPLNVFGINRSPYGEVFAMAMQGPIETNFDVGVLGTEDHAHGQGDADRPADPEPATVASKPEDAAGFSLTQSLRRMLVSMEKGSEERTNPKPASKTLKFYLRRQAEDKLRFAYQLDPSHYANYNSLHFFLTEPAVGTRPELTPSAAKLAQDTIEYCMKQQDDPRPSLTAAAACTNILHLMFADRQNPQPKYSTQQMRQCLDLLDHCLARYSMFAKQWDESKHWDLLSPQRVTECGERFSFISKIRDAAEKTIIRLENESRQQQAAN